MRNALTMVTGGVLVMCLVAACESASEATTTAQSVAATTSPIASTTQAEDLPVSTADPFPAGEPIDLLYISDSGGTNVREHYAELAAEALGREVRLNADIPARPQSLLTTFSESVAEAEIIVFYFNSGDFVKFMPEPNIDAGCFAALDALEDPDYSGPEWTQGTKWEPVPIVPTAEDWQPYGDWLSEVWEAIWEAREGRPVVLRAHDIYNPWLAPWTELGVEPECTAIWEGQTRAIREAALDNEAVFVSFYDLFNGPAHDEDPRVKGWIGDDGMHASVEGGAAAADALAAVGFELSKPPE